MLDFLRNLLRSNYVRLLEDEVARERAEIDRQRDEIERERAEKERLRSENRALLNSLLGTAGFPPVDFPESPQPSAFNGPRLRKRSWHQIQALRESTAHRDSSTTFDDETSVRTNGPVPHS